MLLKISQNPALFRPSGVNSSFHGGEGSFADYIQTTATLIGLGRIDLVGPDAAKIISSNCPFELKPSTPTKKGVLLIHGLFDSPYTLRDLANHLVTQGFLVRSVLLPGHGTVPGDLLTVQYEEWLKAVNFGIQSLAKEVEDIYLLGYSLGGAAATYFALQNEPAIKGLILFAPALESRKRFVDLLVRLYAFGSLFTKKALWYQIEPQTSHVRYESFACNAAKQARRLMRMTDKIIRQQEIKIPLFIVANEDDESVNPKTILKFFCYQKNPYSKMLYYSNNITHLADPRITIHKSARPEQHILNLSHTGLPLSPNNPHYGKEGDFKDFQQYHYDLSKHPGEIYLGAVTHENLKNHVMQRISYNPDFSGMLSVMDEFLSFPEPRG